MLTFKLPLVTKVEFLLTISIQNQANKWWEEKNINYGINGGSNTKLAELTSRELYGRQ